VPARHAAFLILCIAAAPALGAQQGQVVAETEPNGSFETANVFHVGDSISGELSTGSEYDYFAFDLQAGARVLFKFGEGGSCTFVRIFDPSRSALTARSCYTEHTDTLRATAATAGRYYIAIRNDDDVGEAYRPKSYKARIWFYTAPPGGLGNPLTRRAAMGETMGDEIAAIVATPDGDLIVAQSSRLSRVTPDGAITPFAGNVNMAGQIAVDALGDLLVPGGDAQGNVVWRYDLKTGARTTFTRPPAAQFSYTGVTIGADGDVWLSTPGGNEGATLVRFDAFGNYKSQVSAIGVRTFSLTTAQNGELFFRAQQSGDVYRLANNTTPVLVITGTSAGAVDVGADVALDRDGWVYLYNTAQGKLLLYNAQYQLAQNPLAQVLDSVGFKYEHMMAGPVWMRDRNGKMTSRMLVTRGPGLGNENQGTREVLEVNSRGMGAPGADPMLHFKKKTLRNGAVNAVYADTLSVEESGAGTWSVVSGQLPDGVSLSTSGALSGAPSRKGSYDFMVKATSGPRAGFGRFSITVGEAPPVQLVVADVANALMGGASLSPAIVQYLDNLGNKNGRLDVGDFRAYLRSQGQLSGAPTP